MVRTTRIVAALGCCLVLGIGSSCYAGTLNNHPDAISPLFTGSVPFSNGNLQGDLDFAVFTAADFNANFPGSGYVPGDAVVYTYQIFNETGVNIDSISQLTVGIINAANTIGTFNDAIVLGDVDASSENFVPINAEWKFINPNEIPAGQSSWGLAFSSPNLPMLGAGLVVDGGLSALVLGIPTPSDIPVPEPSFLAIVGSGAMVMWCLRRRA